MRSAIITGIGAYVPESKLTNEYLESIVDTSDEWIISRTGIRERRVCAPDQATSDLAILAGKAALEDAGLAATDLDLIILGTSTPDQVIPSAASRVQIGLGANCAAFDMNAACTGFIFGIHQATALIESGRANRVLVIGADALTRFVDFTDRATCILFGDGAGAVVVEAGEEPGILGIDLGTDGSGGDYLGVPAGGSAMPCTAETLEAHDHFIHMVGSEVFKFAARIIPETIERSLAGSGLTIDDVTWLVPHQANQRITNTIPGRLNVAPEAIASNIAWTGNTSAASIPLLLNDLYTDGQLNPGDTIALVAFGAGMTWGSAIVRWTKERTR